jgi:hypothetical protein
MVTPDYEPIRTLTTKGHQSLLVPYNGQGVARGDGDPLGAVTGSDRWSLVTPEDLEAIVDDCGFRMLVPYEVAAAMAFPDGVHPDRSDHARPGEARRQRRLHAGRRALSAPRCGSG